MTGVQNHADAVVSPANGVNTNLAVLTRIIEVRDLSTAEAARGHPVKVRGVVTFNDPDLYLHFVQDDTAGIYLDTSRLSTNIALHFGQRIQVDGFSGPGDYAPIIVAERIEVVGEGEPPPARAATVRLLMTGAEDSQWVSLKGVVRSQASDTNQTVLSLSSLGSIDRRQCAGQRRATPRFEPD